ncbi:16S rRNA pseudouridine516 synthase [Amphritea atlantica]|uniref:Pseudouridine synthase n=1 Tax=Amphritea atlantica TaxID=355243 RepID=A0A1H9IG53_9GAMM|nr:pseudouridine synthase [Amphritea atlantica]SEQ73573.1 16S rRNA pseudouridine516 synthase [Amphritea atlantica]
MQLSRFLQLKTPYSRQRVRVLLAQGRVRVGGEIITDAHREIDRFIRVELDNKLLQEAQSRYLMLHKPAGIVSATVHSEHKTVIELLPQSLRQGLHLAGRLDLKTSGLMLLTNDGNWSRRVTQPESKVAKVYRVTTRDPVSDEAQGVFQKGIYFRYENITTRPAQLERIDDYNSRLAIHEGRYHQVKRMFGYFDNEVTALHRESIGALTLDPDLRPGEFRFLTAAEIALF